MTVQTGMTQRAARARLSGLGFSANNSVEVDLSFRNHSVLWRISPRGTKSRLWVVEFKML